MIVPICIAVVVGMIIGRYFRWEDEDCPARVLGYNCKGNHCDHSKSVLYANMATMAKGAEEREEQKERNLWGGDK